jgi:hypothetical protein
MALNLLGRPRHSADRDSVLASLGDGHRIDCMLISVALAQLTASPEVKRNVAAVARSMEVGTLVNEHRSQRPGL